jgi:hypothetical protein
MLMHGAEPSECLYGISDLRISVPTESKLSTSVIAEGFGEQTESRQSDGGQEG